MVIMGLFPEPVMKAAGSLARAWLCVYCFQLASVFMFLYKLQSGASGGLRLFQPLFSGGKFLLQPPCSVTLVLTLHLPWSTFSPHALENQAPSCLYLFLDPELNMAFSPSK